MAVGKFKSYSLYIQGTELNVSFLIEEDNELNFIVEEDNEMNYLVIEETV